MTTAFHSIEIYSAADLTTLVRSVRSISARDEQGFFWASIVIDGNGISDGTLYHLHLNAKASESPLTTTTTVESILVLPRRWKIDTRAEASKDASTDAGLRDELYASSFTPMEEGWFDATKPITSKALSLVAKNEGFVHELVTGSPVAGHASTAVGHTHNGTDSSKIDMPLHSQACGIIRLKNTITGFIDGETETSTWAGMPARRNSISETGYAITNHVVLQIPDGYTTLNWAVITTTDAASSTETITVKSDTTAGGTTNTSSDATPISSGAHHLFTGSVTVADDDINYVTIGIERTSPEAGSIVLVSGACFWLTA
jgi:hypothetical protein